ncbi:hypothetical protein HY642_02615 [Candidatus Woesearchaeota archaeon]|nr:hypothetical protein [Candidatus Woesearchaeota archaeon]
MKRGQLSVYIILGLTVLVLLLSLFFQPTAQLAPPETVRTSVKGCMADSARNALAGLALRGGIREPELSVEVLLHKTAYLYHSGIVYVPSRPAAEQDLAAMLGAAFQCDGVQDASFATVIGDDAIVILMNYSFGDKIRDAQALVIPTGFGIALDIAEELVRDAIREPHTLNVDSLARSGFNITLKPFDTQTLYVTIDELNSTVPLRFAFVMQYNASLLNNPPRFAAIPALEAKVGHRFSYGFAAVDDDGDALQYEAATALFTIDPDTGHAEFTPTGFDVGTHAVFLTATDARGARGTARITIEVLP